MGARMATDTPATAPTTAVGRDRGSAPAFVSAQSDPGSGEDRGPELSGTTEGTPDPARAAVDKARARKPRETTVPWRLLSIREACAATGRSRATIWRLIADGTFRTVKIGAATSIVFEDLERVIRDGAPLRGRRHPPAPRRPPTANEAAE